MKTNVYNRLRLFSLLTMITAGITFMSAQSAGNCCNRSCDPTLCADGNNCCKCSQMKFSFEELDLSENATPTDTIIDEYYRYFPVRVLEPRIFSGYRSLMTPSFLPAPLKFEMDPRATAYDRDAYAGILYSEPIDTSQLDPEDEIIIMTEHGPISDPESIAESHLNPMQAYLSDDELKNVIYNHKLPQWLIIGMQAERLFQDIQYRSMVNNPSTIQYAYWDLPVPPRLPEEDRSFAAFIKSLNLPPIDPQIDATAEFTTKRINWLHTVATGLQLSQAFISSNWYQGGNNYVSALFNFNWNVALNTVYHPNLMFVSDLSYKLAINSNPKGSVHKYSISQDQFQYTLKTGVKAFNKWFYSLNLLFKTQLFHNYPADSKVLGAEFLSPSEFNAGLGMTYNTKELKDRLSLSLSIAPLSYNLKACPSMRIDHTPFNIPADRKTLSQVGSSAELNLNWDITSNISWKSRFFIFTNYKYFQADWENTLNFAINRFLSTQLYLYPRFDSSSDHSSSNWHYWQFKEILSFGLSYTFSTKP